MKEFNPEEKLLKAIEMLSYIENQLFLIAYSVKSRRAGDGDTRPWQTVAEDSEFRAGMALEVLYKQYPGWKKLTELEKGKLDEINPL